MKVLQTFFFLIFFSSRLLAQSIPQEWDNYIFSLNGRPVSIMLNMALKERASGLGRPYAIILRTKYADVDKYGFPGDHDKFRLDSLENDLEKELIEKNGAIYAGRFTQRGLREFYFYVLDTVDFSMHCRSVMDKYPNLPWLAKAIYDRNWSNYMEVLYPSDIEKEKMENRKMVMTLQSKGDDLSRPRRIEHTLYFRVAQSRRTFLISPSLQGFNVSEMPVEKTNDGDYPFMLIIWHHDKPELKKMNEVTLTLTHLAQKNGGKYEGWQTRVIK
ncbi:MAG: DUF695 domain-containing protein [Sphingobacteriales bacterium]|jgi:uncharacterized protein (TIGR01619 family)